MKKITAVAAAAALGMLSAVALAQSLSPVTPPQVVAIGSADLFPDIVGGYPQANSYYASAALLGNYGATLAGNNPENALIGGDATTNLFQRSTTGASVTTAVTYGGPDRWAYWSGTSTAMTVGRDATAADLPTTSFKYGFKMARTSGQTGVVQMCMMQVVEGVNSYAFQGQTAEFDFHAALGANYSAASSAVWAYIITGAGADEGAVNAAYGLNVAGGGSQGWTTQVNWAATLTASTASNRYSIAAPIPAGTTEIAVAICETPVGTAGTNDYIAVAGAQLVRNNSLTSLVSANASGMATALNTNDTRAKSFARRSQALETVLQQRYYYQVTETGSSGGSNEYERGLCRSRTVTTCSWDVKLPIPMRIAPTVTLANGFAVETTVAGGTLNVCTLTNDTTVSAALASPTDAYVLCTATTVPAAGTVDQVYDDGGTGAVKASAEL